MVKLKQLLAKQSKLQQEVNALENFLDGVSRSGTALEMTAGGVSLQFENADSGSRREIVGVMEEQYLIKVVELDRVNDKLAALEKLA